MVKISNRVFPVLSVGFRQGLEEKYQPKPYCKLKMTKNRTQMNKFNEKRKNSM